jgi:hypothetical protein
MIELKRWSKRLGLTGGLLSTLAFGACATESGTHGRNQETWSLRSDAAAPDAQGKVQVAMDEKGNHDLKVEVKHMAPAAAVVPGTSTYVVWIKPENGIPQNMGVLSPDKDQNAKLETKTSFTSFTVVVTAESTSEPTVPSANEVLSAKIQVAA